MQREHALRDTLDQMVRTRGTRRPVCALMAHATARENQLTVSAAYVDALHALVLAYVRTAP